MWKLLQKRRWRPRTLFYGLGFSVTYLFLHIFIQREHAFYNPTIPHFNYFQESEEHGRLGFVVDTPTCHILNVSAWDKSISHLLTNTSQPADCRHNKEWTYVDRYRNLVINSTAVKASGFSLESISCCFKSIRRVNQSLENYDANADSQIKFSDECHSMGKVTKLRPGSEYIRVICSSKYWPWSLDVIYRNFHATPLPYRIHHKVKHWAQKRAKSKGNEEVPNVLIVGIDSMSRLSFERNMPKTREYLKNIGARELRGYTKLGENTFPNGVAFMMGLVTSELSPVCNYTAERPIDPCPFVWKDYDKAHYLTAFIEDVPYLATYNYAKTGFLQQPVDFYFRPFMLGVQYRVPRKNYYYLECIGGKTVDEKIQNYMEDILRLSKNTGVPSFIYTWITNLAHAELNSAQSGDVSYEAFLRRLDLSNTFLFFVSDHGYRYGPIRQTFAGWYEDKLPNFWVFVPPKVQQKFPRWPVNLEINQGRLTSPLDFHSTLQHILTAYGAKLPPPHSHPVAHNSLSFFTQMSPNRTCPDAGIPDNFCACVVPRRLDVNDTHLVQSANAALKTLNSQLPIECLNLKLSSISAGGFQEELGGIKTFIVAFVTSPGGFLFEGSVQLSSSGEYRPKGQLLRMNKINTDVSCVHDDSWEKFCFCANIITK